MRATVSRSSAWTSGSFARPVCRRRAPSSRTCAAVSVCPADCSGSATSKRLTRNSLTRAARRAWAEASAAASRAFFACQDVPASPATRATKTRAAAPTIVRCRRTNFPAR